MNSILLTWVYHKNSQPDPSCHIWN